MRVLALVVLAVLISGCGRNAGELAFALPNDSQMTEMEKMLFVPRRFRKIPEPAIFTAGGKLWFAYKPPLKLYGSRIYAFSLQKKSLGFIEIDLRNHEQTSGLTHLVDYYENLEPGDYRLKIADNEGIVLEYDFEIVTGDKESSIDYDSDPDAASRSDEDDIISLSR